MDRELYEEIKARHAAMTEVCEVAGLTPEQAIVGRIGQRAHADRGLLLAMRDGVSAREQQVRADAFRDVAALVRTRAQALDGGVHTLTMAALVVLAADIEKHADGMATEQPPVDADREALARDLFERQAMRTKMAIVATWHGLTIDVRRWWCTLVDVIGEIERERHPMRVLTVAPDAPSNEDRTPPQLVADDDTWHPKPGDRVRTEGVLQGLESFPEREPGTAGVVLGKGSQWGWWVRHDDGAEAPYDESELRPEPKRRSRHADDCNATIEVDPPMPCSCGKDGAP